ncbi:MFS transporter [Fonticella tunisiensis]|uniref:Na+/melibiose symporter-like transporter n=1 Tax=Fonticella tunisiensis TaxID=1096341 RepID=A0A4R7KRC2_9CLOT|nr:MFS transporter [Fonticella tunisiensis]TDT61286.1 Na+/melibiose symporter-like transporter [Fonticella tunisiensis]
MDNIVNNQEHRKIPVIDKIGYGSGNFSVGVSMQVVGAYLVFYCTAILGIPGSLVGLAVSLSIVWDAVTDPLMGYFSDITRSKTFGRRHLYLLIGGIGIALTNFFLWNIDASLPDHIKFTFIFIDILAVKTFMTIFTTPYTALGAELSNDYNERTTIQGIKTIFFLLGLSLVSVIGMYIFFQPTHEYPVGQLNPKAYNHMGLFSSIIVVIFALICYLSTKKYIPLLNQPEIKSDNRLWILNLVASFKSIFSNSTFRYVAFTYMFTNISSALLSNIGLHVFTYTFLLSSQQIAVIVGIQLLVSILSQPAWTIISKKLDKKPAMNLGLFICIAASFIFLIMVLLKDFIKGSAGYFIPFAAIGGFGTGGLFTLPLSMIADIIDQDELKTGKRSEGTYYGCLTLLYKFTQSITLLLIGFLLDIVNFDASLLVQSEGTVVILGLILGIGSILSFAAAFMSLAGYKLNREKVEQIQMQIMEVKKAKSMNI